MRSLAIAAGMTVLVAGVGFVLAPERGAPPASAASSAASAQDGGREAGAGSASDGSADRAETARSSAREESGKRTFYQWTDERGSVRFARSLDEVPPAWRAKAGQIEVDAKAFQPKPARREPPRAKRLASGAAAADAERRRDWHEITVYTAPWCGWCRKTLAFLDAQDVEYVNKDIEADEEYADELREKSGGTSIPFVEIDGTEIRGYNPSQMAALLE